jgi:predicted RNA binding protein YcfA (HicA-like mRNA interferase family)
MKRADLVRKLEDNGWWFKRHGSRHDVYTNGTRSEPIERHNEIPDVLARKIIKRCGLK